NRFDLTHCAQRIGRPVRETTIAISHDDDILAEWSWQELFDAWWSVTHAIQSLRDDPACAEEEKIARRTFEDPGLTTKLSFDPEIDVAAPHILRGIKPRVAILREQ